MKIGNKIEKLRKKRKLSYRKLAELSDISSYSYIRNIEKGIVKDPSLSTIIKLARGLEISISELLDQVEI